MCTLKAGQSVQISYISERTNQSSVRIIIPFTVPDANVTAIDVSELDEGQHDEILQMVADYNEYRQLHYNKMFNFTQWAEHTQNKTIEPKFRTFKIDNITVLE